MVFCLFYNFNHFNFLNILGVDVPEMMSTFNMGIGFVLIVRRIDADEVLKQLSERCIQVNDAMPAYRVVKNMTAHRIGFLKKLAEMGNILKF